MKVREVIELKGWVDGSGYSYTSTYSDQVIDVEEIPQEDKFDWSWWDKSEPSGGVDDVEIVVKYYDPETDDDSEPLAEYFKWESKL